MEDLLDMVMTHKQYYNLYVFFCTKGLLIILANNDFSSGDNFRLLDSDLSLEISEFMMNFVAKQQQPVFSLEMR